MQARIVYFILQMIVFGIGAGIRYAFFFIIGRKKDYEDLIAPNSQDKWNVLVGAIFAIILIYFSLQIKAPYPNYRHPPYEYRYVHKTK